jgi:hypothetical protein
MKRAVANLVLARNCRPMSGLPYRIRAPLAKLQARKEKPAPAHLPGSLGDGEALETGEAKTDFLRLALTSRVYDFVQTTPLVHAAGMSERLGAVVHLKREDLNNAYTFCACTIHTPCRQAQNTTMGCDSWSARAHLPLF